MLLFEVLDCLPGQAQASRRNVIAEEVEPSFDPFNEGLVRMLIGAPVRDAYTSIDETCG